MTLEELQALLQPSQSDRDNALNMGLLQAGLGILAHNTNKTNPMPALGAGGLMGLQGYQQSMQQGRKDQIDRLQMMMLLNKLKKEEELNKAILGDAPQQKMQYATADRPISLSDSSRYADGTQRPMIQPDGQKNAFEMIPKQIRSAMLLAGKPEKLGEMAWEATKPNKQVHGGYVVDMNQSQNGQLLPQINISANGQMSGIDSTGSSFIPRNALENYSQFRNADEAAKAGYKLETITPPGGTPILTTTGKVVDKINGRPQDFPKVSPEQQSARDAERKAIVAKELNNPANIGQPGYEALQKEASSLGIPLQGEEEKARIAAGVKVDSERASRQAEKGQGQENLTIPLTEISNRLKDPNLVLGSTPADRAQMIGHQYGLQTRATINTQRIRELANQLTLANGSLGAGVSNADRDAYEKAQGRLTEAKSHADMKDAVDTMLRIAQKYSERDIQVQGELKSGKRSAMSSGGWTAEIIRK